MTSDSEMETETKEKPTKSTEYSREEPSLGMKIAYTITLIVIISSMLSIPLLAGIPSSSNGRDPLFVVRTITASQRGTFMELGIIPLVLAILTTALLRKRLKSDNRSKDIDSIYVFCFTITFSIMLGLIYIFGGAYGPIDEFGIQNIALIVLQLFFASGIIGAIHIISEEGYGIGKAIYWIIGISISFDIFDGMFSLKDYSPTQNKGCVIVLIQTIIKKIKDLCKGIHDTSYMDEFIGVFDRAGRDPDILGLLSTFVILAIIIYLVSIKVEIPSDKKSNTRKYNFFQNLEIPLILTKVCFSVIYFISNLIFTNWSKEDEGFKHFLVSFFGRWENVADPGQTEQLAPTSGLAAFITAPYGPDQVLDYLGNSIGYLILMGLVCGFMSWLYIHKLQNHDEAFTVGVFFRGILLGLLVVFAEYLGPLGTGTGIVLFVLISKKLHAEIKSIKNEKNKN